MLPDLGRIMSPSKPEESHAVPCAGGAGVEKGEAASLTIEVSERLKK
jgi:hypothetical protein